MERFTPEKMVALLEKKGTKISVEEAAKALELMRLFAKLLLEQHFKK